MKTLWKLFVSVGLSLTAVFLISLPSFAQSTVCAPVQFEAKIAVSTSPGKNILKLSPNAQWSYDYANRREFSTRIDSHGNKTSVVLDFGYQPMEYVWTTSAQGVVTGCQAKYVSGPMADFCGTPDGTAPFTLGGSLSVSRWTATFPGWQFLGGILGVKFPGSIGVEGISSVRGFLPVSMTAIEPGHSAGGLLEGPVTFFQALFTDVMPGIRNPNVFQVPAACR